MPKLERESLVLDFATRMRFTSFEYTRTFHVVKEYATNNEGGYQDRDTTSYLA